MIDGPRRTANVQECGHACRGFINCSYGRACVRARVCVCMRTLEDAHGVHAAVINDVDADMHIADDGDGGDDDGDDDHGDDDDGGGDAG